MSLSRSVVVAGWVSFVGALLLARAAFLGTSVSAAEVAAWAVVGIAPLVVARFVVGGPASPTIAQVLYPTDVSASRGDSLDPSGSNRRGDQS